jgi:uncharacterized protein YndB with AHSA1/START domain
MLPRSVTHSTFVIERRYPSSPEGVFRALANPACKTALVCGRGTPPGGRVPHGVSSRRERAHALAVQRGLAVSRIVLSNDGIYQDIVPNRRIVIASTMTLGERRISASLATFEILPWDSGTILVFTHQGAFFEGADGPERREERWNKLLDKLANEFARNA